MEQALAVFLVLGLLALLTGGLVVVLVLYSRERALARRVDGLEKRVRDLAHSARETSQPVAQQSPPPLPERAPPPIPAPIAPPRPQPELPPAQPPPRAPSTPSTPPAPKSRVSLERALGVTGAAVLGGVVFAIAGIYLYQYSVQQGLLTPSVRIVLGTVVGLVCLGASELLRKRGYRITADSLAGGAVVVLLAAFWAANRVFHLWPFALSFGLMAVVTALCCVLALRHKSQVIAVLGLVGGFATPLLLSTGEDRPVGLFGWTLLVDLAFLSVAHKRRWPMLGMIALLGTTIVQALWIFARMGPHTFLLAIAVLSVFAVVFVVFVALQPEADRTRWQASQIGAVLLPFAFAVYFSSQSGVLAGGHFYPTALLAALLCAAASWIARSPGLGIAPLGAAAGSIALALVWVLSATLTPASAWELSGCCALIAVILHVARVLWPMAASTPRISERDGAALLAASGLSIALIVGIVRSSSIDLWPWAAGLGALAALACWQAIGARQPAISVLSSVITGIGLFIWTSSDQSHADKLPALAFLGVLIAFFALYQLTALRFADEKARCTASWAAGACALFAQVTASSAPLEPRLLFGAFLGFGALSVVASTSARSGFLHAIAALVTASVMWSNIGAGRSILPLATVSMALGAAIFTLAPFVRRSAPSTWRVAAAASLLWFFSFREMWSAWLSTKAIGLVPLVLFAIVGAGWVLSRENRLARTWFGAVALVWLATALPLQLDHEWLYLSLALAGASEVWLWTRRDHAPLKYVGTAMLVIASSVLVLERFDGRYDVYEAKLVNWLAWIYLAPAAASMLAAIFLSRLELSRITESEKASYRSNIAWCASVCGLCAAGLAFAWINLAILNAFGTEPKFHWLAERVPARDLSMSLAWALYAIALLILGVNRRIGGLRWISLGLFVLTIAKVFLFDLGNLQGLYRVASLLGLAVALFVVSLLYQRFVFKAAPKEAVPG